jgi:hypothetical protein
MGTIADAHLWNLFGTYNTLFSFCSRRASVTEYGASSDLNHHQARVVRSTIALALKFVWRYQLNCWPNSLSNGKTVIPSGDRA